MPQNKRKAGQELPESQLDQQPAVATSDKPRKKVVLRRKQLIINGERHLGNGSQVRVAAIREVERLQALAQEASNSDSVSDNISSDSDIGSDLESNQGVDVAVDIESNEDEQPKKKQRIETSENKSNSSVFTAENTALMSWPTYAAGELFFFSGPVTGTVAAGSICVAGAKIAALYCGYKIVKHGLTYMFSSNSNTASTLDASAEATEEPDVEQGLPDNRPNL